MGKRADVEDVTFSGHAPHITMTVRWRVADDVSGEVYSYGCEFGECNVD